MNRLKPLLRPIYAPLISQLRRRRDIRCERLRIRQEVARTLDQAKPLKVIIGAGRTRYDGWIATDMPAFDVLTAADWARLFPPGAIDRMLAEHVFEHVSLADFARFLQIARRYLAPAARVRIAVPDGCHPDSDYIESVRPGGTGIGADDHKTLYTFASMGEALAANGYRFELLEYFDAAGRFQRRDWRAEDGYIGRSALNDRRNRNGELKFTSLIVDCWLVDPASPLQSDTG